MARNINIIPQKGEHALSVGQNGSGKTVLNCWLLLRIPEAPVVIYDTKIEPKFEQLPKSRVVHDMEAALKLKDDLEVDYIVVRPPVEFMLKPQLLDHMLWLHFINFQHCPAYIDEAYTFHVNGKAGVGLTALLTRGRSKGISTLISTQRPVLLSRFCITEAKKVYILRLVDKADRKRLNDVVPNYADMQQPDKHGFYFFEHGMEEPILYKPVTLDKGFDTGYTDDGGNAEGADTDDTSDHAVKSPIRHVWI